MKTIPNKDTMQQKVAFVLIKENVDPSIQGRRYPVSIKLPMQDYIYSSKTEENELIQYIKENLYGLILPIASKEHPMKIFVDGEKVSPTPFSP